MQRGDTLLATLAFDHAALDERFDEIRFPFPVRLAALRLDAPAAGGPAPPSRGALAVFARDLEAPGDSRYACVAARVAVPLAGGAAVALDPVVTDRVILRGRYGKLEGSLHGCDLKAVAEGAVAAPPVPLVAPPEAVAPLDGAVADALAELVAAAAADRDLSPAASTTLAAAADAAALPAPDGSLGASEPPLALGRRKQRAVVAAKAAVAAPAPAPAPAPPLDERPPGVDDDDAPPGVEPTATVPVRAPSSSSSEEEEEAAPAAPAPARSAALTPSSLDRAADAIAAWLASPSVSEDEPSPRVAAAVAAAAAAGHHAPLARRLAARRPALESLITLLDSPHDRLVVHAAAALDRAAAADPAVADALLAGSLLDSLALAASERLPAAAARCAAAAAARAGVAAAATAFGAAADTTSTAADETDTKTVRSRIAALARATDALAAAVASTAPAPRARAAAARADPAASARLAVPRSPDKAAVTALTSCRVWARAAAALRCVRLHSAVAGPRAGAPAPALAAALVAPLVAPLSRLVAVCLAAPGGGVPLLRDAAGVGALADALGPPDATTDDDAPPTARIASVLRAALAAEAAAAQLASAPRDHPDFLTAAEALAALTATDAGERAVAWALVSSAPAFDAALAAVAAPRAPPADGLRRKKRKKATWLPEASYCAMLVATVACDARPAVAARFARVAARAARALDHAPRGPTRPARAAAEAGGRAVALAEAGEDGVGAAVEALVAALPPLCAPATPGAHPAPAPAACIALLDDDAACGTITATLDLLAGLCGQRGGARAAAAAAAAGALDALDLATRVASSCLAATSADVLCETVAGDAIDPVAAADARARASLLATAAAAALGALLRRLRALDAARGGASAADALLRLHAEAVAAGDGPVDAAATPTARARSAAAAALQAAYLDVGPGDPWAPDLIANALARGRRPPRPPVPGGGPPPADDPPAPADALATLALLTDILPDEWPPAGAARPGKPHPPPRGVAARGALAHGCEPAAAAMLRLVTFAATSQCVATRASLTTLLARGAGLGGGMGPFLSRPLADALADAAAPASPLATGRAVLETLVPLAYRPAVKAALLDLGAASALAKVLARAVPAALSDPATAGATVVMALEVAAALVNPAIALDPSLPAEARGAADAPPRGHTATLAAVLLASMPRLGVNAGLSARVLGTLAETGAGRAALGAAAVKWRAQVEPNPAVADADADAPGTEAAVGASTGPAAALAWAAARLRSAGDGDAAAATAAAALDAAAADGDAALTAPPTEHTPAPQRFAAAVAAAARAAGDRRRDRESDGDSTDAGPGGGAAPPRAADPAARVFWRNLDARHGEGRLPAATTAPWDAPPPGGAPLASASALPAGGAPRKRPRGQAMADLPGAVALARLPARGLRKAASGEAGDAAAADGGECPPLDGERPPPGAE